MSLFNTVQDQEDQLSAESFSFGQLVMKGVDDVDWSPVGLGFGHTANLSAEAPQHSRSSARDADMAGTNSPISTS
ncbi:hypothetical protein ACFT9I_31560 [Streptomyces sp. NPDC057137]|uniref:hypothetical protein n=1 Tax=Streptomyces sp. NPDC057137 TaxID=3346030 RepID=UPI00362EDFFB